MSTIQEARHLSRTRPQVDVPPWLKEAKAAVRDFAEPNALIYWADLLLTLTVGYACAVGYLDMSGLSWQRVLCYVVAVFAIFRATSFVHEIVHMRSDRLRSFQIGWDLLCGIPMLFPSFAYWHHLDHHDCDSYGTDQDGEYLPFGVDPPRTIGYFLLLTLAWPFLVVLRFLIMTPISFVYPPFRPWLLERFSSFGIINFRHRLAIGPGTPLKYWAFLDIACCLRTWAPDGVGCRGRVPLDAGGADVFPRRVRPVAQLYPHVVPAPLCEGRGSAQLPGSIAGFDHAARRRHRHRAVCAAGPALSRAAPPVSAVALSRIGAGTSTADERVARRLRLPPDGAIGHRRDLRAVLEEHLEQAQAAGAAPAARTRQKDLAF